MHSQQASDIVVMEEGKAVAHGTHLLPSHHHHRFAQLNLLWKTGPLSQLKSQPGFVASLLDRIEQNQGAAAAGQSRGPGTLSFASLSCSSSSSLFPPWPSPSCAAVSVESALFALEEACGSDAGVQGAMAVVVLGLGWVEKEKKCRWLNNKVTMRLVGGGRVSGQPVARCRLPCQVY